MIRCQKLLSKVNSFRLQYRHKLRARRRMIIWFITVESVFVLIRGCYIQDNLKSTLSGKDKEISVNISFEIKTGGQSLNSSLGTYSNILDWQEIQIKDIVVLPLQQVSDYFTLTVNVIEESELPIQHS